MKNAVHQYEDKLLEFAYGELPNHEADAVDAHVRGCARCSEALGEIRGVRAAMSHLPMQGAPDAGLESLLAYAQQAASRSAQAKKAARPLWLRVFAPLGAVMAVLTVGIIGLRANQEFDTSKAAVLAEQKADQQRESREEYAPPGPSAAVAPPPAKNDPRLSKLEGKTTFGGESEAEGAIAGGLVDDKELSRKDRAPLAESNVPARNSQSVRSKEKAEPSTDALAQDFSNAMGKGAVADSKAPLAEKAAEKKQAPVDAPAPPVVARGRAEAPGPNKGFGINDIGSTSPGGAKAPPQTEVAKQEATLAPAPSSTPVPSKQGKSSFELGQIPVLRGSGTPTGGGADDADGNRAVQSSGDTRYSDDEARFRDRQQAELRTTALKSARAAADRGDTRSEVNLLLGVYARNPTGMDRVETLRGLCDGLTTLGEDEKADRFCDELLSKFPESIAARALSQRRNMVQRAAPKPATVDEQRVDEVKAGKKQSPTKAKSSTPSETGNAN